MEVKPETKAFLLVWGIAAIITLYALRGLAATSVIVGEDRVAVKQTKAVLIYTAQKQYRNDRLFKGGFE